MYFLPIGTFRGAKYILKMRMMQCIWGSLCLKADGWKRFRGKNHHSILIGTYFHSNAMGRVKETSYSTAIGY